MDHHSSTAKCFEQRFTVTFQDTSAAGNVYFATYFRWQGLCRELLLALLHPRAPEDLQRGSGFATRYAHMDFVNEVLLFQPVLVRMTANKLTRIQVDFGFDFFRDSDDCLIARGSQGVVWTGPDHRPSRMPPELHTGIANYYGLTV